MTNRNSFTIEIIFDFSVSKYQTFFYNFKWLRLTLQFAALSHRAWQFVNNKILQGSVAMQLRCGEIFNKHFVANLLMSLPVTNLESWLAFGKVMDKILVS